MTTLNLRYAGQKIFFYHREVSTDPADRLPFSAVGTEGTVTFGTVRRNAGRTVWR
jgi:hypothetical protein